MPYPPKIDSEIYHFLKIFFRVILSVQFFNVLKLNKGNQLALFFLIYRLRVKSKQTHKTKQRKSIVACSNALQVKIRKHTEVYKKKVLLGKKTFSLIKFEKQCIYISIENFFPYGDIKKTKKTFFCRKRVTVALKHVLIHR